MSVDFFEFLMITFTDLGIYSILMVEQQLGEWYTWFVLLEHSPRGRGKEGTFSLVQPVSSFLHDCSLHW